MRNGRGSHRQLPRWALEHTLYKERLRDPVLFSQVKGAGGVCGACLLEAYSYLKVSYEDRAKFFSIVADN